MRWLLYFLVSSFFFLSASVVFAIEDTTVAKKPHPLKHLLSYSVGEKRSFQDLEANSLFASIPTDSLPANPIAELRKPTQEALKYARQARKTLQTIKDSKLYTALFNPTEQVKLPIGIHKKIGNQEYTIGIDSVVVTPQYSYLVAYLMIENPSDSSKLYFVGKQIRISKKGGLLNARLELAMDYGTSVAGGKGMVIFRANTTYATFDCNGFQNISVDASVVFSKDWLVVERPNGSVDTAQRVIGDFRITMNDWSDLLASINFRQPFQLRELPGYGFSVKEASFDFSDIASPAGMRMPQGYLGESGSEGLALWRGFYLREAELRLPPNFKNRVDSSNRKTINIQDLIIDQNGVSAKVKALNLYTLDQGDMGKWKYSLDSLGFELTKNQLVSAGFKGRVVLPISKETETLAFNAIIRPRDSNYEFTVKNTSALSFPVMKAAQVNLSPSSYLEVKSVQGKFIPRACLTGSMTIGGSMASGEEPPASNVPKNKKISFPGIEFTELEITSQAPYLRAKAFGFTGGNGNNSMAGFPVTISNLGLKTYSDGTAVEFDLRVNFVKASDGGFSAGAGLSIVGEMKDEGNVLSFHYKRVDVKKIMLDISQGNFSLKGELVFFKEDATYGNGFQGLLKMKIPKPSIEVSATALFGTTLDEMRYWYADASVLFQGGLPLVPPLKLTGFSGAAYYQMKQVRKEAGASATSANQIGVTQTGLKYEPDSNSGLGIRAGIKFATQAQQAFNGDATLELAFNKGGGLQRVFFNGNGYFATEPQVATASEMKEKSAKIADKSEELKKHSGTAPNSTYDKEKLTKVNESIYGKPTEHGAKSQISAGIHIEYNVEARTLDGGFKVYVNAAQGNLKGIGANNLAGEAILHFSPSKWYIQAGSPTNRMGLELAQIARTTSYLMIGDDLPGSPAPPQEVSNILGGMDLDYMRDLNALGNGSGFAFGADLRMDTGNMKFLMFYARFLAGAGFDIMVKNYGTNFRCEGSNEPIGINGWYSSGQVYAYLQGEIGMDVNVKFYKGKFKILQIAAAAILQAKLPNPTWMRGAVGGRFSILGGLVKGNCKFEMTLGKECKIIGTPTSPVAGMEIIAELTPKTSETGVDVFANPQAVFNIEVEKVFDIQDLEGNNRSFRVKLEKMEVKQEGAAVVVGALEWNEDKTVVVFNSPEVLPSEKKMMVEVVVSFEERVNGTWKVVLENGVKLIEKRTTSFTTGKAPDYIPASNVAYSYPAYNQLHYYPEETPEGYIQLIKGQAYLFEASTDWERRGKLSVVGTNTANPTYFDVGYDASKKEVFFERPQEMKLNQIYLLELVNVPLQERGAIDANVSTTSKIDTVAGTETRQKTATGVVKQLEEKSFFSLHFKSSRHAKFTDKMNALSPLNAGWTWPLATGIHEIGRTYQGQEFFDKVELASTQAGRVSPLIEAEADPNALWMSQWIRPLNYEGYPQENITINQWREPLALGVPPLKDIYLKVDGGFRELTPSDISVGTVAPSIGYSSISYMLALSTYKDYFELRSKAASHTNSQNNAWMQYILSHNWVSIQPGTYPLRLRYRLPGKGRVTSEWTTTIQR
ncbi:hypothetical protein AD998_21410 [bacterium 336/3]|nr:hypothetical protein AD998_21410 [bacterium 336/3]